MTWTLVRRGHLKRESESLLIAAQNDATRINHVKAKINYKQKNNKCRLSGKR